MGREGEGWRVGSYNGGRSCVGFRFGNGYCYACSAEGEGERSIR